MKVFHRYVNITQLTPTKGDYINEIETVNTIKEFATIVNHPKDADICYIRANPQLFKSIKGPKKVYFASPYDKYCYDNADAIATFTDEWTRRLKRGLKLEDCPGHKPKYTFTVMQGFNPMFKPLQNHPKTLALRKKMGGGFILGHFGAMRKTTIPYSLMKVLPGLKKKYKNLNVVFSNKKWFQKYPHIKQMSFDYTDMPYVFSACDMLYYPGFHPNHHVAGSRRIMEAMACGIPHILPRYKAKEDDLGKDYPYFHDYVETKGRFGVKIERQIVSLISKAIENTALRKRVSKQLIAKSKNYTRKKAAEKLKRDFRIILSK